MGQYYKTLLTRPDGTKEAYCSHNCHITYHFDNGREFRSFVGIKLMEHSWIGNPFVNRICKNILNNPARVAWVGDYADAEDVYVNKDESFTAELITQLSSDCWGGENEEAEIKESPSPALHRFRYRGRYLVNHTKKEILDFDSYLDQYTAEEKEYGIPHPLSLLTAIGNGKGGGDYRGDEVKDGVGSWANDLLEITDDYPTQGYNWVMFKFLE